MLFLKFLQKHLSSDLSLLPDYQTTCLHKTVECSVRFVKKSSGGRFSQGPNSRPARPKAVVGLLGRGAASPFPSVEGSGGTL